jgi:hypothetical protein
MSPQNRINSAIYWKQDIEARHCGAPIFLSDVARGVFRNELNKPRPKVDRKDLSGRLINRSSISLGVIESIARRESNLALGKVDRDLQRAYGLTLSASDEKLVSWCEDRAGRCAKIIDKISMQSEKFGWSNSFLFAIRVMKNICEKLELKYPVRGKEKVNHEAAILRMCSSKWWRRQVRTLKARAIDQIARSMRLVHAGGQNYCSDEVVRIKKAQRRRNRMLLEGMEATNDIGDKYLLSDLADLSPSNPAVRKAELMVRMRGFETVADELGHVGVFLTMTAPSRFHPARQIVAKGRVVRVIENENYKGATVREAQDWICKYWNRTRAGWDKLEIKCYGFRVVEPHADGCPHWHALLFFQDVQQKDAAVKLLINRFMKDAGDERGAQKYRVKAVDIDKSKGSATGYIAKYISKNIDGENIKTDSLGLESTQAAERILSWASTYGSRQFQQVGGASVQVWRELRKMDDGEYTGIFGAARAAADSSNWAAYCLVMGGVFVKRDDQPIRLARWHETKIDYETGEENYIDNPITSYGEDSPGKIFGVVVSGVKHVISRFYRWTVERVGEGFKKGDGTILSGAGIKWLRDSCIKIQEVISMPVTAMDEELMLDLMRGDGFN